MEREHPNDVLCSPEFACKFHRYVLWTDSDGVRLIKGMADNQEGEMEDADEGNGSDERDVFFFR